MVARVDIIEPQQAGTLYGLFRERVRRTPDNCGFRFFSTVDNEWHGRTWAEMAANVARWQAALAGEKLHPGDRIAIMLNNCIEWVLMEQAALGVGLVVVPLYMNDRPDNVGYILQDANVKVLLIHGQEQWHQLKPIREQIAKLTRVLSITSVREQKTDNLTSIEQWLEGQTGELHAPQGAGHTMATIVYTSGTTGRPKGVMLSHHNILWNAHSAMKNVPCYGDDVFLSFLPLSHTLERTAGYYLPMMAGATIAYARSIPQLAEDLLTIKPTVLISVPRIFERIALKVRTALAEKGGLAALMFEAAVTVGWDEFLHRQGKAAWHPSLLAWPILKAVVAEKILNRLGGRLRVAVCGGAPLPPAVAKVFIGLGLPLVQGYGMTETSPIVSVNTLDDNDPASVGAPLQDVGVRIGENDELLVNGPGLMLGYWNNPDATRAVIDSEGWLHTGDRARIENKHIYIIGRLKEIIVLANGEKIPPADMEAAILEESLFEQAMVIGEGKPYLCALIVLNAERWKLYAKSLDSRHRPEDIINSKEAHALVLEKVAARLNNFPGYAQIRRVALQLEPWTVDNELLTPTLKLRRARILECCNNDVEKLYHGH